METQISFEQVVRTNQGQTIGLQVGTIHGDVQTVQVYRITGDGRAPDWHSFLVENAPPYRFLSPYTARDRALFKGRDAEVEQVARRIAEQRVLVVYGQPGVGKTSLLAAGAIPVESRGNGAGPAAAELPGGAGADGCLPSGTPAGALCPLARRVPRRGTGSDGAGNGSARMRGDRAPTTYGHRLSCW